MLRYNTRGVIEGSVHVLVTESVASLGLSLAFLLVNCELNLCKIVTTCEKNTQRIAMDGA